MIKPPKNKDEHRDWDFCCECVHFTIASTRDRYECQMEPWKWLSSKMCEWNEQQIPDDCPFRLELLVLAGQKDNV